jgi:hypothetical protein
MGSLQCEMSSSPMSVQGQNPNLPHRNTDAGFTSISRPQQGGFNATICVESRCGAVAVGRTYLFPPLSSGGALVVRP